LLCSRRRSARSVIDKVSNTGGHLGPSLSVVELTIAAHRVLDSPRDVLLFDTGHQAYVHKILTGWYVAPLCTIMWRDEYGEFNISLFLTDVQYWVARDPLTIRY
jgi:hypothetical protein